MSEKLPFRFRYQKSIEEILLVLQGRRAVRSLFYCFFYKSSVIFIPFYMFTGQHYDAMFFLPCIILPLYHVFISVYNCKQCLIIYQFSWTHIMAHVNVLMFLHCSSFRTIQKLALFYLQTLFGCSMHADFNF